MIITGGVQPTITYRDKNGVMVKQGSATGGIAIPVDSGKTFADVIRDQIVAEQIANEKAQQEKRDLAIVASQAKQIASWSASKGLEVKSANEILAELKGKRAQGISPMGWVLIAGVGLGSILIIRKLL